MVTREDKIKIKEKIKCFRYFTKYLNLTLKLTKLLENRKKSGFKNIKMESSLFNGYLHI